MAGGSEDSAEGLAGAGQGRFRRLGPHIEAGGDFGHGKTLEIFPLQSLGVVGRQMVEHEVHEASGFLAQRLRFRARFFSDQGLEKGPDLGRVLDEVDRGLALLLFEMRVHLMTADAA